jgi:hypothetical protein
MLTRTQALENGANLTCISKLEEKLLMSTEQDDRCKGHVHDG